MRNASPRFRLIRQLALLSAVLVFGLTSITAAAPAKGKAKGAPAKGAASQPASRPVGMAPNKPEAVLKPFTEQLIPNDTLSKDQTDNLLVLHTNDIHDIIKDPPGDTLGGMAYLAAYNKSVRAKRPDTLILNAGDMLQKGDAMSIVSKGEAAYRALGATGCDVTIPGNHDFFYGMDAMRNNIKACGIPVICTGVVYEDTGEPVFQETLIKEVDGLKVGLIGATIERGVKPENGRAIKILDQAALGKRVDELARKMEPEVDLTVVVYHIGTFGGKVIAKAAPTVDLVITGHSNEVTQTPMKAESGALVVNMGRAGQWVGWLDMVVDKTQKKIGKYTFEIVPMDHKTIKPDPDLEKQIAEWDKKWPAPPQSQPAKAESSDDSEE